LLDLQSQYLPLRSEIVDAIIRVCDAQHFILGAEVEEFEREVGELLGVRHVIGVSSGTDALLVSLMALGIGPGDEVIVPTLSFFATAGSVSRLGATPVFVDVDDTTLAIDVADVDSAITERTKAVIPVHLYGLCADIDPLNELAVKNRFFVVEDAAQALGATYKGRVAGTLGAVGCFSFFPSKNVGAFGDAGMVTTNDDRLAHQIRLLRNHGASPKYHHRSVGGNFRLDALQAAVLRVKLSHLQTWNASRRANADVYRELFTLSALTDRIRLPTEPAGRLHIYHQYVIRVRDRDSVRTRLHEAEVGTEVYYPVPFHRQECFSGLPSATKEFPVADAAAREVLALPIYPGLTRLQQEHVVGSIAEAV
jgi:dTDP-4-amino-4,6-dideoxygalactose transaminase